MVLSVYNYRYYLLESHSHSQGGGDLLLGFQNFYQSDNNGAILTILQMIKNVMASASKADCADLLSTPWSP